MSPSEACSTRPQTNAPQPFVPAGRLRRPRNVYRTAAGCNYQGDIARPWIRTFLGFTLSRSDKRLQVADKPSTNSRTACES
jgi:hypothetical protein